MEIKQGTSFRLGNSESEVLESIEEYFDHNTLPETPISLVWTAHKALLRGKLISLASAWNKLNMQKILTLTSELDQFYNYTAALTGIN